MRIMSAEYEALRSPSPSPIHRQGLYQIVCSIGKWRKCGWCVPELEWGRSGEDSVPAAAGIVDRLLKRRGAGAWPGRTAGSIDGVALCRHTAGIYGDLIGLAGRGLAKLLRLDTCYQYRHQVGEACCWPGALRGLRPRTREGRIGPTAQLQGTGAGGQGLDWAVSLHQC